MNVINVLNFKKYNVLEHNNFVLCRLHTDMRTFIRDSLSPAYLNWTMEMAAPKIIQD